MAAKFDFIKSLVNEFSVPINDISKITGLSNQIIRKKLRKKTFLSRLLHTIQNIFSVKKKDSQKTLTQAEHKVIMNQVNRSAFHINEDGINSFFFNNGRGQYCVLIQSIDGYKYFQKQQLDSELNKAIITNRMDSLSEAEISLVNNSTTKLRLT
jgi:hypothetical protein